MPEEEAVMTEQLTRIDGERLKRAEEQRQNDGRPIVAENCFPDPTILPWSARCKTIRPSIRSMMDSKRKT